MNVSTALLTALKDHGAREIFGIPGDFALSFFKVIEESGILPLYTMSHEPGVGFAADAAARFNSALGVAAVTYGAGALNMINAVAAAYAEKSPLVVISGAPGLGESHIGLLLHHQIKTLDSQWRIYEEITCDQIRLDDPDSAPDRIARVLHSCLRHSRPVYIELPRDQVFEPCEPVVPLQKSHYDEEALAACVDDIMATLERARSPVFMAGVEVRRYRLEDKVATLARKLGVPVATSFMGRGLFAKGDAPLLGAYMGMAGDEELTHTVEESDALLLLGVILSDTNLGVSARQIPQRHMIHVADEHVQIGFRGYNRIPMAPLIDAMLARLADREEVMFDATQAYPRNLEADDAPITPLDIATAVNDFMDAHGRLPMSADMGDCYFTALEIENTELVGPGYYATMGYGVPAGLGVQAATGKRTLILVGDGAFQMTGWELGNCRRYGWNPIVLLFNNASWEMLRTFQPESAFSDLDEWSFAALARNLGGRGVRVQTRKELQDALDQAAQETDRFFLIEIMLEKGALSPTLRRFTNGLVKLRSE